MKGMETAIKKAVRGVKDGYYVTMYHDTRRNEMWAYISNSADQRATYANQDIMVIGTFAPDNPGLTAKRR